MKDHNTPITPESVLVAVKEMFAESRAEFDRRSAEFDQQLKESSAKFDREMKESREDFDRRMKKLGEHIGGVANSYAMSTS